MGYPDSHEIPVSDTQAYRQFGNSVVVPAVKHIACSMRRHIFATLDAERPELMSEPVRKVTRPDRQVVSVVD
jgi:DNA (cytosine-5)-methyltransferase 1